MRITIQYTVFEVVNKIHTSYKVDNFNRGCSRDLFKDTAPLGIPFNVPSVTPLVFFSRLNQNCSRNVSSKITTKISIRILLEFFRGFL